MKLDKEQTIEVNAYDAGTEMNNERAAFIPGPPFGRMGVRDPDAQLIAPHKGIVDKTGDLTQFGWRHQEAGRPDRDQAQVTSNQRKGGTPWAPLTRHHLSQPSARFPLS